MKKRTLIVFKIISHICAILAVIFLLIAILIAIGTIGNSNGFIDATNLVALGTLVIAFICSVIASTTALIYKLKLKSITSDTAAIGVIITPNKKEK